MKLGNFLEEIQRISQQVSNSQLNEIDVIIPISTIKPTLGKAPSVSVKYVATGIDWDANSIFIIPEDSLGKVSEFLED